MDDDNDKMISYNEFSKALRDYKVDITENEYNVVFEEMDRNGDGRLSIDEIVRGLRGEMN
jgi:Ca2+-binding EF-hand superfamily protein